MTWSGKNPYLATRVSSAQIGSSSSEQISPSQLPKRQPVIYTSNPNPTASLNQSATNFKMHLTWPVILAPCTRMQQLNEMKPIEQIQQKLISVTFKLLHFHTKLTQ